MKRINVPSELKAHGFCLLQGLNITDSQWTDMLHNSADDFSNFIESWNNLPADEFLSDGGHFRFRRYSVFNWQSQGELKLLPHEPHFQSTYRNNMNGGINRNFEPFQQSTLDSPILKTLTNWVAEKISLNDEQQWRVQGHQFRIVANADEAGNPTPEGIHRDGADFILIMVLKRENITGGVNHIYDNNKRLVFGSVLTEKGDAVILDDRMVWHGVSEVFPVDEDKPAYRDVLVLTFHNQVNS